MRTAFLAVLFLVPLQTPASAALDLTGVQPGPIGVVRNDTSVTVTWPDETARIWRATFSLDPSQPLYAHMNINYIKLDRLPAFDRWGEALAPLANGEFFTTTGEVLLPEVNLGSSSATEIVARSRVLWTFPLRFAEIVWGDGQTTHRDVIELADTREFGSRTFEWRVKATGWTWARVAVWDVAGNGAFVNPFWRP